MLCSFMLNPHNIINNCIVQIKDNIIQINNVIVQINVLCLMQKYVKMYLCESVITQP